MKKSKLEADIIEKVTEAFGRHLMRTHHDYDNCFECPKCSGIYWHTPDVSNANIVACSCYANGVPLSGAPQSGVPMCRWTGPRETCGLRKVENNA